MSSFHSAMSVVVLSVVAQASMAAPWAVTLLEPAGASQSRATGAYNGVQSGNVTFGFQTDAMLWHGTAASAVNLGAGQGWFSSNATAISGDQVTISASNPMGRAVLYSMSSGTYTDLTPPGYFSAATQGVYGGTNTQVGSGFGPSGSVMLMWNGTAGSFVNLTPAGWASAAAAGAAGNTQVGNGVSGAGGFGRPFITYGTAASYVELTPAGATSAGVAGCDLTSQVGGVLWPSAAQGHAALWYGTADSVVDLHPAFAASSAAAAVWGMMQVGAYVPSAGGLGQAVRWESSAASAEDLHQYVTSQLGAQYLATEATGIDPITGNIVGNAFTTNGVQLIPHAIMWSREIPGPGTAAALALGMIGLGRRRRN